MGGRLGPEYADEVDSFRKLATSTPILSPCTVTLSIRRLTHTTLLPKSTTFFIRIDGDEGARASTVGL
jgi:hypothetical protein